MTKESKLLNNLSNLKLTNLKIRNKSYSVDYGSFYGAKETKIIKLRQFYEYYPLLATSYNEKRIEYPKSRNKSLTLTLTI